MKSLNKFIYTLFIAFIASYALSQQKQINYPAIQVIDNDTVIIFKIDQAKKLATFNEERKKLLLINDILKKESVLKDSIIGEQKKIIDTHVDIEKAQQVVINEKGKQIDLINSENKVAIEELKKQKRYKFTAIVSGILSNLITILVLKT